MYWMNGMAGTGKSTIAYTFCERLEELGLLGANFFCSRVLADCSDIRRIIPTISRQLAWSSPQFESALLEVLKGDFKLPTAASQQFKRLIYEPFRSLSEPIRDTLVIVVDALDECSNGAEDIRTFLETVRDAFGPMELPLKMFVTSRPKPVVKRSIMSSTSISSILHLHDIEKDVVQADIRLYVHDELT